MNVDVSGPQILWEGPFGIRITETVTNTWIVMIAILLLCLWLTHNLSVRNPSRKQLVAEKLVSMLYNMVESTMGKRYSSFAPYIGALFTLSIISSLSGLTGMRPPTADLSTTLAWALLTFVMIQVNNIRIHGFLGYLKGFTQPIFVMTPINLVSEIANPISMSFRHFGNIASGLVITGLVYGALAALSSLLLGWIPVLGTVPLFQVGIPAFLSLYFDVFTSFLQAYIICMLTMVFVSNVDDRA